MSPPRSLRSPEALAAAGLLTPEAAAQLAPVAARYAIGVTPTLAARIVPGDPHDPLAAQFVPRLEELDRRPEELADPIGDDPHAPLPGLVHRYRDRVLLKVVQSCPVYCRFCFRRETVGPGAEALSGARLDAALAYIAAHPEISEVILTGGDPFMLPAARAAALGEALGRIPHVAVLRWHTRVPVADPSRVTPAFVAALRVPGKAVYVALHANHPREFGPEAESAVARIIDAGLPMLSQSVLLAGVNADVETLAALMRLFVRLRIKPYYLHHPDLAPGTAHFRPSLAQGRALYAALRAQVSGLAVPHYVIDIPGGHAKALAAESDVTPAAEGWHLRDAGGRAHPYPESGLVDPIPKETG